MDLYLTDLDMNFAYDSLVVLGKPSTIIVDVIQKKFTSLNEVDIYRQSVSK